MTVEGTKCGFPRGLTYESTCPGGRYLTLYGLLELGRRISIVGELVLVLNGRTVTNVPSESVATKIPLGYGLTGVCSDSTK